MIRIEVVRAIVLSMLVSVLLICSWHLIYAQTSNNIDSRQGAINNTQVQWTNYTNDKFGFSVEYPQSWIIQEKQNRFESGAEAEIESPDLGGQNYGAFDFIDAPLAPTSNIRVLTNLAIQDTIGGYDVDYDSRLIENANVTRYEIDGERVGSFTYVLDKKDFVDGESTSTPIGAAEVVTVIHNGKSYLFQFRASPDNFDNPVLTDIRQHIFNSIKWLN